jgi:dTDP-4-dehydrorhamnose reductase
MKILLIGKNGQIGFELERVLPRLGELIAFDRTQMDLANFRQIRDVIHNVRPDLIVNAAAYTAVDNAEIEQELAMRINGVAPGIIAEEAKRIGAAVVHYSTDYVFDGLKGSPYTEQDFTHPINIYGETKLIGEEAIKAIGIPYLILRTSWVYGMRGKNFLTTILDLAKERSELQIVNDQHGAPTWCRSIADITVNILGQSEKNKAKKWWENNSGLYHLTSKGEVTWFGFAKSILAMSSMSNPPILQPINSSDYSSFAKRPGNSRLDTFRLQRQFQVDIPMWEVDLLNCYTKSMH